MEPAWLEGLFAWLRANPGLAGLVIALVAFAEGLPLLGIVLPGILLLFGIGALVGVGAISLATAWGWAVAGALAGDSLGYWLGRRYRDSLRHHRLFRRYGELFDRGEQFFHRHGPQGVVLGRLVGPVRPVMPVVAGMLSMPVSRFLPAAGVGCLLWAPAYLLPGVVFGASVELARAVALRLAVLVCLVVGLVWGLSLVVFEGYRALAPRAAGMLEALLRWSLARPGLGRVTRNLVDPRRPESGTVVAFGLLLVAATVCMVLLLIVIPISSGPIGFDQAALDFMARLRTPWADPFMAWLSGLGHVRVLLPGVLVVLAWLLWRRRYFAAAHWVGAGALGLLLSLVIGYLVAISRAAVLPEAPGEALPLVHIGLSVTVYGFFAILVARELPRRRRMWPYLVAAVLIGLLALARLYFAAHWLSDVLVGVFMGLAWITVLGIAYRTRIRRSFWTAPLAAAFFGTIAVATAVHGVTASERIIRAYTPAPPVDWLELADWLAGRWRAPESNTEIDFQYAGAPEALAAALATRGWEPPREADWAVAFEMLQPDPDYDSMPLLPRGWRGQPEVLLLHRVNPAMARRQTVLRLWQTPARLADGRSVFVGEVQRYRVGRVTWFFRYWRRQAEDAEAPAALFRELGALGFRIHTGGQTVPRVATPPDAARAAAPVRSFAARAAPTGG